MSHGSRALTRPSAAVAGATDGGELEAVVDLEAALWLRLELAEGVATVPRCSLGCGHSQHLLWISCKFLSLKVKAYLLH